MADTFFAEVEELMRETIEGARPGSGTQYLDHDSGIRNTLNRFSAKQASAPLGSHPTIAGQVRHMVFHLKSASEWIAGDHSKRDWKGSFLPRTVNDEEWDKLKIDLEKASANYMNTIKGLPPATLISESGGMGVIAHLAYHLGAIRQYLPPIAGA
jgi:hypothetical protein